MLVLYQLLRDGDKEDSSCLLGALVIIRASTSEHELEATDQNPVDTGGGAGCPGKQRRGHV